MKLIVFITIVSTATRSFALFSSIIVEDFLSKMTVGCGFCVSCRIVEFFGLVVVVAVFADIRFREVSLIHHLGLGEGHVI